MSSLGTNSGGRGSSRRRSPTALLLVCGALASAIVATGCGGGSDSSSSSASTSSSTATAAETTAADTGGGAAVSTDKIEIADFKFGPETVTVKTGTEVTWTNSDDAVHTATADDSSFDTGDLNTGDSASVTFDKPGTFTYYCRFHPFMKATVEVQ